VLYSPKFFIKLLLFLSYHTTNAVTMICIGFKNARTRNHAAKLSQF